MRVVSDIDAIQAAYGFHPIADLLAPGIRMDDPKMVTPVILERDGDHTLLAREQETGNVTALGVPPNAVRYFERYFSFDNVVNGSTAYLGLPEALADLTGGGPVHVDGDMPYRRYRQIREQIDVRLPSPSDAAPPVTAYALTHDDILDRFRRLRESGLPAARRVVEGREHLRGLRSALSANADTRFTALDAALDDLDAETLLSMTPPNGSELTGLVPAPGRAVLLVRGADRVYLLVPDGDYAAPGVVAGRFPSLTAATRALGSGDALAVEDGWLPLSLAQDLEASGWDLRPASSRLSKWREFRDHEDLGFALIAAQASRYCIEGALSFAEQSLGAGRAITERDVYRRYLELIPDFRREFAVPFAIAPFFVNCHAANRTVYPAIPVEFTLSRDSRTLKFDAGLKVAVDGVVLGTSDVARTLVTTPVAKEAYDTFLGIIRDEVIASLRPGTVCQDVHRHCVDAILAHESRLVEIGIMPAGIDLHTEYGRRNVGHLMGKQESFSTEFRPGHDDELHEGAIGAVEIQWPYGEHSIAAEDLWFVGADQTYVTSR